MKITACFTGLATLENQPPGDAPGVALGAMQLLPHCPEMAQLLLRQGLLPGYVDTAMVEATSRPAPDAAELDSHGMSYWYSVLAQAKWSLVPTPPSSHANLDNKNNFLFFCSEIV
jgi:hypothetical protein